MHKRKTEQVLMFVNSSMRVFKVYESQKKKKKSKTERPRRALIGRNQRRPVEYEKYWLSE